MLHTDRHNRTLEPFKVYKVLKTHPDLDGAVVDACCSLITIVQLHPDIVLIQSSVYFLLVLHDIVYVTLKKEFPHVSLSAAACSRLCTS